LPVPEKLREEPQGGEASSQPRNLLVIDTQKAFSLEEFAAHDTAVLLTGDSLVWEQSGRTVIESISRFPNVTLDRSFIASAASQLGTLGRWLAPLIVFSSWFFFIVAYSVNLVYLFVVGGALAWFIGRFRKLGISYRKSFQLSLHAFTLPALFEMVITDAFWAPGVPFLGTFVLALVLWMNLKWEPSAEPVSMPGASPAQ
jgi:hypothetical protein